MICPIRRAQEVTSFAYDQDFYKRVMLARVFLRYVSSVFPVFPGWRQVIFLPCQDTELSTGEGVSLSSRYLVRISNVSTSPTGQGGGDDLCLGKKTKPLQPMGRHDPS